MTESEQTDRTRVVKSSLSSGRPCSTLNTQLESHYPVQCARHTLVLICRIKIPRVLVAVMLIIVVPWLPLCPSRVTWQLLSLSVLSRPCSGPRIQNKSWQGWLQSPEQILGTLLYYTMIHTHKDWWQSFYCAWTQERNSTLRFSCHPCIF